MASAGHRVIAVAVGTREQVHLVGLVGLQDPPREDSVAPIRRLRDMGVRVLMVTGDDVATARAVGVRVGFGDRACSTGVFRHGCVAEFLDCDIFASTYPEDKFRLVEALQRVGHTVGMTGDGVNDAPALKQAEVGIASGALLRFVLPPGSGQRDDLRVRPPQLWRGVHFWMAVACPKVWQAPPSRHRFFSALGGEWRWFFPFLPTRAVDSRAPALVSDLLCEVRPRRDNIR